MTHKQGEEFIKSLATQLQNGGGSAVVRKAYTRVYSFPSSLPSPATFRQETSRQRLEHALRVSVESLPDGDLKLELAEKLNQYADKLQRLLEGTPTGSRKEATVCPSEGGREGWPFSALTIESLKEFLGTQSTVEESSLCLFEKLVFCCHSNTNQLVLILSHWSKAVGVSVADCVRAAEVCTRLTAGTPCQALLPWLQFCFDVLSVSAESVLSGRGGVTDEGAGSSVLALLRCLLHTLTVAHLRKQAKPPPKGTLYGDLMSGLASLTLDLTIQVSSAMESIPQIHSSILTVLGRDELLDAVLQVKSEACSAAGQVLLPLISKVLEYRGENLSPSPAHFVKLICCCNKVTELTVFSTIQHLCSRIESATQQWTPPPDLCGWLWTTNPSVCQSLGLKMRWSTRKHIKYLLQKLSSSQTEQLLELAASADRVAGDRRLVDSEEGRCLNEQDAPENYMTIEHNNDADSDSDPRSFSFFTDTAGSAAASAAASYTAGAVALETSSGMDPDKDSDSEGYIPGTLELAQRLVMEDCSADSEQELADDPAVKLANHEDAHFTDDRSKSGLCGNTSPLPTTSPATIEPRVLRSSYIGTVTRSVSDSAIRKRRRKNT